MLNLEGLLCILSLLVGLSAGVLGGQHAGMGWIGFAVCIPVGVVAWCAGSYVMFRLRDRMDSAFARRPMAWFATTLAGFGTVLWISATAPLLASVALRSPDGEVRFVIPDGVAGSFVVRKDPAGSPWRQVVDAHEVDVPISGVVGVDSLDPIRTWHRSLAHYSDGTPIPKEHVSDAMKNSDDGCVRFYGCWTDHTGDTFYIVGTRSAVRSAYSSNSILPGLRKP